MISDPILIDDGLSTLFTSLQTCLGVKFDENEINRVFEDCEANQVDEKSYVFLGSPSLQITGHVEDYEPDYIDVQVVGDKTHWLSCNGLLDEARNRHLKSE